MLRTFDTAQLDSRQLAHGRGRILPHRAYCVIMNSWEIFVSGIWRLQFRQHVDMTGSHTSLSFAGSPVSQCQSTTPDAASAPKLTTQSQYICELYRKTFDCGAVASCVNSQLCHSAGSPLDNELHQQCHCSGWVQGCSLRLLVKDGFK